MTDYIGGWTLEHLERAFSKLAPTCEYCHGKCTFICIEQCCVGSGLFCIDCDREHWLHRKNQFKVLFINKKHVKSRAGSLKDNLTELVEYFRNERQLNERVIQFYQRLQEMYVRAIDELQAARSHFTEEESNNERMLETLQRVLSARTAVAEDREQLSSYIRSLNLYDEPFQRLESITNLSTVLDSQRASTDVNIGKLSKVLEKIREVGTRCRNCLESFVLSSNIEQYIAVPNTVSYGYDFNTIDRSVELLNDQKTIGTLKARRAIIVRNNNNVPFSAVIQNHISELHTDSLVDVIPNGLQSLSYLNLFYPNVATSKSFNMRLLPESLKCLRLAMNPELRYRISYQLDHLVNLQTLYLIDGGISSQEVRYVREYGQRQQLRMLCIMGIVLRSGCRNVRNYWAKIETCYNHKFEKLRRHYLINKRKMLQCMFIQRKLVVRDYPHFVENILSASMCQLETELDRHPQST